MKLLVKKFFFASSLLDPDISSPSYSTTPSIYSYILPLCERPSFTPIKTAGKIIDSWGL
jgi:hypothetical protein